jgi:aspartate/tyrosine/aromatic aminotransferase
MYSNPPIYGAKIVSTVLNNPELTKMWHGELRTMSGRIKEMRTSLV